MEFAMMSIDRSRQFASCRRFLLMQLESVQKLLEMGIPEEVYQEVTGMFCNHATNLYVCGLIDEEFYRFILDDIVKNDALEGLVAAANDIRKDIISTSINTSNSWKL